MSEVGARSDANHLRSVLANWGGFLFSVLSGLYMSPFIVGKLGTSGFGVWVLIGSLTGTLNIFDLGTRAAVIRFVARESARGDHAAASRIASAARIIYLGAGALVLLTAAVLAAGIKSWFQVPPEYSTLAPVVLLITAITLAIAIATGLYGGVVAGMQRLDLLAYTNILLDILRVVLVVVVLSLGGGLLGLALIMLGLAVLRYLYFQRLALRLYPELHVDFRWPQRADVRMILSVSGYATVIYASVSALAEARTLIIGAMLPVSMVAYYSIGKTLPTYASAVNGPIAQTVQPRASRMDALGDAAGLREVILRTGSYSALVLLPMLSTFIVRGRTFIGIWMGDEFKELSGDVLAVLAVGAICSMPRWVIQASFVGSGRHATLAPWYVAEALIVIALTILVIPAYGIMGAATAGVVPAFLLSAIVLPVLCKKKFGLPIRVSWLALWLRPMAAISPFVLVSIAVDRWFPARSYVVFFAQVFVCLPLAAGGVWLFALNNSERKVIRNVLYSWWASLSRILR